MPFTVTLNPRSIPTTAFASVLPDAVTVYSQAHVAVTVTFSVWAAAGSAVIASSPAAATDVTSQAIVVSSGTSARLPATGAAIPDAAFSKAPGHAPFVPTDELRFKGVQRTHAREK